jgi:hypothetical protein
MKSLLVYLSLLLGLSCALAQQHRRAEPPKAIVVTKPTVIAFFAPMTQAEANSGEDDAEALSDFNFYAYQVEARLKQAGIRLEVINGRWFRVRVGGKVATVRIGNDAGYYFIAPGKKPHVEHGVMTDEDLVDVARKYFALKIP